MRSPPIFHRCRSDHDSTGQMGCLDGRPTWQLAVRLGQKQRWIACRREQAAGWRGAGVTRNRRPEANWNACSGPGQRARGWGSERSRVLWLSRCPGLGGWNWAHIWRPSAAWVLQALRGVQGCWPVHQPMSTAYWPAVYQPPISWDCAPSLPQPGDPGARRHARLLERACPCSEEARLTGRSSRLPAARSPPYPSPVRLRDRAWPRPPPAADNGDRSQASAARLGRSVRAVRSRSRARAP